jgi:holin-like protein
MYNIMKYLSQFLIILGFTLLGEALQQLIPLPIPASVYGIVLLFLALCLKLIKVAQVKDVGGFLTSLLPLLFVSPTVGIVNCWTLIQPKLLSIVLLLIASTVLVFGISGAVTQALSRKDGGDDD